MTDTPKKQSSAAQTGASLVIWLCLIIGAVFFFKSCGESDNSSDTTTQQGKTHPYHTGKFTLQLNAVTGSEELGKPEHAQFYVGHVKSQGAQVVLNDLQDGREYINTITFDPFTGVGKWECRYPLRGFDQVTRGTVKATVQDPRYGIWLIELFEAGQKVRTGALIPQ